MLKSKTESSLIAYNALIQIIGRLFFLFLAFINIKLITLYLTPAIFGEYTTILTFTGFFTVLIDLGLFTVAVREISKNRQRQEKILANILSLRIISAVIATAIAIILGYSIPKYAVFGPGIALASVAMFVYFISNILDVVFHVNMKMGYISLAEIISKISTLLMVYISVRLDLGLMGIIAAILFGSLTAIAPRLILAKKLIRLRLEYDPKIWLWLLKLALPLGLVFILNNLYFKIDSQMLYLLTDTYEAGLYGLAYRIMETTLFVSSFITAAITPALSRAIIKDRTRASTLVSRTFEVLLSASFLLLIAVSIFSKEIILLLADPAYLEASLTLVILAGAASLIYLNALFGTVLIAADQRKILIYFSLILLTFNISLNWLMIPVYGYIGAALATLISEVLVLIFNLLAIRNLINLKPDLKTIGIILIATLIAGSVFITLKPLYWLAALLAGLLIYFIVLLKTKVIKANFLESMLATRADSKIN